MTGPWRLEFESGAAMDVAGAGDLAGALARLAPDGDDTFAILHRAQEYYVQALVDERGFIIEKREGNAAAHWSAARPDSPALPQRERRWWQLRKEPEQDRFTREEVEQVFGEFMEGRAASPFYKWVRLELPR